MGFPALCGAVGGVCFSVLGLVVRSNRRHPPHKADPFDTRATPWVDPSKPLPERIAAMQRAHVARYRDEGTPPRTTPNVRVLPEEQWANRAALYDWAEHETA